MGIRFFCPNGHKLNVKQYQAGQRGVCPRCGAKIEIPTESTRVSSRARRVLGGAVQSATAVATPPTSATLETPAFAPLTDPTPAVGSESPSAQTGTAEAAVAQAAPVAAPTPTAAPSVTPQPPPSAPPPPAPPPPAPVDPITQGGNVSWYVRPSSGGQYGPAQPDVMRSWLGQGRVSPDAMVWREGWQDWQPAGEVFAELRGAAPDSETISLSSGSVLVHRVETARRRSRLVQLALVGFLALAAMALVIVLLLLID